MIRLNDIRNALIVLFSSKLPGVNIVTEDISQIKQAADEDIFPFLHIQLIPLKSKIFDTDTRDDGLLVDLTYMEDTTTDNERMYETADKLKEVIAYGFNVKDRFLKTEAIDVNVADDLLHVLFNLDFNNGTVDEVIKEKEEAISNIKIGF